jgi:hypothetical protein
MWRILKAEIKYNRTSFVLFLITIPVVLIYAAYTPSGLPHFIAWLMAFLMVNTWNALRIREKREFQLVQLPVSVRQLALARMLMVILSPAIFVGIYAVIQSAVDPKGQTNLRALLTLYGLIVLIFSLAFVFRDRAIGSKLLKQGKIAIVALGGLGVAANIYALVVFRRLSDSSGPPPAFIRALAYVLENNPSTTNSRTIVFLVVSLALALLTVVTFVRRRTYIE